MNNKLIIKNLYIIFLLEARLGRSNMSHQEYIISTLDGLNIPSPVITDIANEANILHALRDNLYRLLTSNEEIIMEQMLSDIMQITAADETIYDSILLVIGKEYDELEIVDIIRGIKQNIELTITEHNTITKLKNLLNDYVFKNRKSSLEELCVRISEVVDGVRVVDEKSLYGDKAISNVFDLSDREGALSAIRETQLEEQGQTLIKFPWKAMNRMTHGGLRRGQLTTVTALQHNNKSGFCLSACIGACVYNDPKRISKNPDKKPLILYISLENDQTKYIADIYRFLKGNIDDHLVTDEELARTDINTVFDYIIEKTSVNGYHFMAIRVVPSEWTYRKFFDLIETLESKGYEIHLCCLDYIGMIPRKHIDASTGAEAIQTMFNLVRNFIVKKHIALLTPYQLAPSANELYRSGIKDFVLEIAKGNHYANSTGIGREIDLELFIHIEIEDGKSYQTIARGKHRISSITSEKDKYTIIPFSPEGGLKWDLDKPYENAIRKIGQNINYKTGETNTPDWMGMGIL